MSNISTALDAIKTRLETLFPGSSGYVQLTNPYELNDNPVQARIKGWGLSLGAGTNTKRLLSCQLSVARQVQVIFTRASQGMELQTVSKEAQTKELLEDQFILIKDLEKEPMLNNNVSGITRFEFKGDDGIQFVDESGEAWFQLVCQFELEYFENLNS